MAQVYLLKQTTADFAKKMWPGRPGEEVNRFRTCEREEGSKLSKHLHPFFKNSPK